MTSDFGIFFENLPGKFKFHYNMTRIMGTLHEYQYSFISRSVLFGMRNVSDKKCTENQNTFCVQIFFFFENGVVYEIMCKNVVEPDRPQMTI
jgi:hypothetical protein